MVHTSTVAFRVDGVSESFVLKPFPAVVYQQIACGFVLLRSCSLLIARAALKTYLQRTTTSMSSKLWPVATSQRMLWAVIRPTTLHDVRLSTCVWENLGERSGTSNVLPRQSGR